MSAVEYTPHGIRLVDVFDVNVVASVERSNGRYHTIEVRTKTGWVEITFSPSGRRTHVTLRRGDIRVYDHRKGHA